MPRLHTHNAGISPTFEGRTSHGAHQQVPLVRASAVRGVEGIVEAGESLEVVSELDEGGVVFGDGIETDRLAFRGGMTVTVRVARDRLRMVARVA